MSLTDLELSVLFRWSDFRKALVYANGAIPYGERQRVSPKKVLRNVAIENRMFVDRDKINAIMSNEGFRDGRCVAGCDSSENSACSGTASSGECISW